MLQPLNLSQFSSLLIDNTLVLMSGTPDNKLFPVKKIVSERCHLLSRY